MTERPDRSDLDARIEVVEPYATPDHPPKVLATIANVGDRPVQVNTYIEMVLWPIHSEERSPGVSVGVEYSGSGSCWQAEGTPTVLGTSHPHELAPGESASTTLAVQGHRENEGVCLPTGTFHFVDDFPSVRENGENRDWTVEFSLRIDAME